MRPQTIQKLTVALVVCAAVAFWVAPSRHDSSARVALSPLALDAVAITRAPASLDALDSVTPNSGASESTHITTRTTPRAPRVRGRVIDATTLAPIVGWTVQILSSPDRTLSTELADLDGAPVFGSNDMIVTRAIDPHGPEHDVPPSARPLTTPVPELERAEGTIFRSHEVTEEELRQLSVAGHASFFSISDAPPWIGPRTKRPVQLDGWTAAVFEQRFDDVALTECVTDSDGRFEFACPIGKSGGLVLRPRAPIYAKVGCFEIADFTRACSEEIEWKVEFERRELFRGRVVDAASSAPVAQLSVALRGPDGTTDACMTDPEGRFVSKARFGRGFIVTKFKDGPESLAVACTPSAVLFLAEDEHVDSQVIDLAPVGEATLCAAIGPTFRFEPRIARTFIDGDLSLRFVNLKPAELEPGEVNPLGEWIWAAMRRRSTVSFRCPTTVAREHDGPVFAEMIASGGLLFARVELASITAPEKNPVPMVFEDRAVVHGRITRSGDPLSDVAVSAVDLDGAAILTTKTQCNGEYFLPGLDLRRTASVVADAGGAGRTTKRITLRAGESLLLDFALAKN